MPHILILDELLSLMMQLHVYSNTLKEKIDGNEYHGNQLQQAQELQASVETFADWVNTQIRAALDSKVAEVEGFLGI